MGATTAGEKTPRRRRKGPRGIPFPKQLKKRKEPESPHMENTGKHRRCAREAADTLPYKGKGEENCHYQSLNEKRNGERRTSLKVDKRKMPFRSKEKQQLRREEEYEVLITYWGEGGMGKKFGKKKKGDLRVSGDGSGTDR